MTIAKPYHMTHMLVWNPKYSAEKDYGEYVALLHKRKVDFASPVIIVEFRAKHLQGQRFCIRKQDAMRHEQGSNGTAPMYIIPMSHFESWETPAEVRDLAFSIWEDVVHA